MIVTELSERKAQKRRLHHKVRSGCLTCKTRRVKCDERRPSCLRCIKFGVQCNGYSHLEGLKRRQINTNLLSKSRNARPHLTLSKAPSSLRFESDEESRYFDVFSTSTAYEISPNVEMGRLRLMFLQACEFKDSIRHAIIALGALDMTSQGHKHNVARGSHGNTPSHHYQHAIKEYGRAIKYAQTDGEKDFRTALFTSLVILSFEGWVGNHELAVQQIKIGASLLKEWREQYREKTTLGLATPAPSDDENVLSHVFTRLSIQLRSAPKERRPQPSVPAPLPALKIELPESFQRMPESFSTLAEAGKFYSAIVRFAVTFVTKGLPHIARASSLTGTYSAGAVSSDIPPEIAKAHAALTDILH